MELGSQSGEKVQEKGCRKEDAGKRGREKDASFTREIESREEDASFTREIESREEDAGPARFGYVAHFTIIGAQGTDYTINHPWTAPRLYTAIGT